ncbi:MAG: leucine/isoleucine/valine transporter permease subunit [Ramlibacter sp.]|nr:leucine/isoleucine/valine transporter permease subunit [Ramlibacter sp.]
MSVRRSLETGLLLAVAGALIAVPWLLDDAGLVSVNVFVILSVLALSMALVWGVAGIFSFGQSVFFGLGAYSYAVLALNGLPTGWAVGGAIVLPAVAALAVGYFLFYGRISDVYLGVITLTASLILYHLVNTVSGSDFRIGEVALGGYNGMPGVPPLAWPGSGEPLDYTAFYLASVAVLAAVYLGLRALVASRFGAVVCAIRENELRAELLGYDSRAYKLAVFVIAAAIAGLAGALHASWGGFVGPDVFSISFAAQIIIWAQVGGVALLAGPVVGCWVIQWLTTWLGTTRVADTNLVLGVIFVAFVLLLPGGLLPRLREWLLSRAVREPA